MKKSFVVAAMALLFLGAQFVEAATVTISSTSRPVNALELGAGVPAGTVFEFFVDSDVDIVSIDQVDLTSVAGSLWNELVFHNSNTAPPNPALAPAFPETVPSSFITTPGTTSTALGSNPDEFTFPNNSWFDASDDGPQAGFRFAQLTLPTGADDGFVFSGRLNVNDGGEVVNIPFAEPIPEPATLALAGLSLIGVISMRRK